MGTASQQMAEFVAGLRFDDLPPDVIAAARRHMLDSVGVALAASALGAGAPVIEMTRSWAGAREASVIGYDFGAPAPWAALANGTLTHALDFDDTHVESVVHPSAFVVPAAMAVGEEIGASGRDIVTAAVAGYEVATRIGAAAPGRFHVRGQHTTGLCGTFGAAAVAGRLWGLTPDEIAQAIGIVAEPRAPRLHPATTYQAQFSLPFAVASAIVGGRDALEYFGEDARADRRVLTLAERVHHEPDTTLPFPKTYGGRLRVNTRGGRTIEVEELVNRGHPDRPLSDEELAAKFL